VRKGDFRQAIPILERTLQISRDFFGPFSIWTPFAASKLGFAYTVSGRAAEGLALLKEAVQHAQSINYTQHLSQWTGWLGEGCLVAGRLDEAATAAGVALDLARRRKERGAEAWAQRLLGEIAAHPDPPDAETAEGHYHQALALAIELGMRPLAAHCHLGLGKLYRRTGKREQAQEHLTTATAMYSEMDMGFWLEKAEAETSELA
jgi:tetratricopeptide (TPR) repeat protein